VAEAAADRAAAVIRPLFRSALLVEAKGDASPVTRADREAEEAIRALLAETLPDHGVIGEEHGSERPDAEWVWVLDPIDGTRAFVTGRPIFGSLLGLLHRGKPVLGIIDQPITGERCRPCPTLAEAELSSTSPDMFSPANRPGFDRLRQGVRRVTWGGDCYAYGLVALGLIDVVAESDLQIWDWAALVPVIEGAGGRVTDWAGAPLHPGSDGRVIALGDPRLLPEAVHLLQS
jgi:myo-inositol-1(or 4)-monophosphatase